MNILVVLESDEGCIRPAGLSALQFAREVATEKGGQVEALVLGHQMGESATAASYYAPVACADHESLAHPLADRYAPVIAAVVKQKKVEMLVAATSSWAKDIIGRAAGLLGGAMASDVAAHTFVDGQLQFTRTMFAGEISANVVLHGSPLIVTVRNSGYDAAEALESPAAITALDVSVLDIPMTSEFVDLRVRNDSRPDPTEARVVVSGGRAIKNSEDFEALVGGLADKLGAAMGSSRALVDEGIAPNELQIGQTGKVVAPELYLALGLSGAIQHLAGMNNSKVIASINKDPEAPIFSVSNYGLVGDVYELVPELLKKLR